LFYNTLWTVFWRNTPRTGKDIRLWQELTRNGEKGSLFENPNFIESRFLTIDETMLLPPRAFTLHPRSRIRKLNIGADLSRLNPLPPNLNQVLPSSFLPTADVLRQLSQPAFK